MPTPQKNTEGLQQSQAASSFDWDNCPQELYQVLKAASDPKSDSLNLSKKT